jgi:G3E family GTPase
VTLPTAPIEPWAPVPVTIIVGHTPMLPVIERMVAEHTGAGTGTGTGTVAILDTASGHPHMDPGLLALPAVTGQRTPDCGCCQARLDIVDGLRILIERPTPPSHIVVWVGDDDDIATVVRTVLSDPDLGRLARLDSVIATVDAPTLSTRLALNLPVAEQHQAEQLAIADRVLVMGSHHVTAGTRQQVIRAISTINRVGFIVDPGMGRLNWSDLSDIDGWHGAPLTTPRSAGIPAQTHLTDGLETITCWVNGEVNPPVFDEWINDIVTGNSSRILRLQGALRINGQAERTCLRGVRSFVSSHSESEHAAHRRSRHSVLAIVGNDLDAPEIRSGFMSTIAG